MTSSPVSSSSRRSLFVLAGLAFLAVLAVGAWWLWREPTRRPPAVDTSGADADVAELLEASRREVLAHPRSGSRWGRLGMVLRAHGYGDEANECFAEAERLDPREPAWPYLRGLTLVLSDPTGGTACLRRAVERMDARDVMPRFRLVEVLLEQGQLDDATRHLDQALAADARHPRGRLLRARLALTGQEPKKAIEALDGTWDDPHARRQARLLAVQAWQQDGDAAQAERLQREASDLPPDFPWRDPYVEDVERLAVGVRTRLAQAVALRQQGRGPEAIRLLELVVQRQPNQVAAWVLLGQMRRETGNVGAAETAYRRAVQLDPGNIDAWFGLGVVALDRPREAAVAFRKVVAQKPDHTLAHYLLGESLKKMEDWDAARKALNAALRCQPDHEPSVKALAEVEEKIRKEK